MRSTFEETVFQHKSVFRKCDVFDLFGDLLEGGVGCFRRDFDGVVIILARNPDAKNDATGSIKPSVQSD